MVNPEWREFNPSPFSTRYYRAPELRRLFEGAGFRVELWAGFPAGGDTPRHAVVGWDANRLAMVLAVLEARCAVAIGANDVYLNVAGGLRINEPAADLAAAAALVSSLVNAPLPPDAVYFGEISLSGAVRPVAQTSARLKEAAALGFTSAVVPQNNLAGRSDYPLEVQGVGSVEEAVKAVLPS